MTLINVDRKILDDADRLRLFQFERKTSKLESDFLGGLEGWNPANTGTGSAVTLNGLASDGTHHGVLQVQSGSTAAGRAAVHSNLSGLRLGTTKQAAFRSIFKFPSLADTLNNFVFRSGFLDGVVGQPNGLFLTYGISGATNGLYVGTYGGGVLLAAQSFSTIALNATDWFDFRLGINYDTGFSFQAERWIATLSRLNSAGIAVQAETINLSGVNTGLASGIICGAGSSITRSASNTGTKSFYLDYQKVELAL
jgi:hypothetical protein